MPFKDPNMKRSYMKRYRKIWYGRNFAVKIIQVHLRKMRLISEGKCKDCGVVLIEDEGQRCVNCSDSSLRRM